MKNSERVQSVKYRYWAIASDPERAAEWVAMFGENCVPIKSPVPTVVLFPESKRTEAVYALDMDRLSDEQKENVVAHIVAKWNEQPNYVRQVLAREGLPVEARAVSIVCAPERAGRVKA